VTPDSKKVKKQDAEVEEIRLFGLGELPEQLAFEHAQMIKDHLFQRK
jgi:hypothetical protein